MKEEGKSFSAGLFADLGTFRRVMLNFKKRVEIKKDKIG
jgi:uncharacterized protein YrrD